MSDVKNEMYIYIYEVQNHIKDKISNFEYLGMGNHLGAFL